MRRPLRLWFENISAKYEALCESEDFNADDKKNIILRDIAQLKDASEKRAYPIVNALRSQLNWS